MKRSLILTSAALAVVALAGCQSGHTMQAKAPTFDKGQPAYLSMSAGDRLGSRMVEDRIYIARTRNENNAYAAVPPQFEGE